MSKFLDKILVVLFLLLVVFTALAHGAVEAWSLALSSVAIVGLLLLWICKAGWEKTWTVYLPAPLWPLVALIVWGLVQSIAWTDQAGKRASLSLDVEATRTAVSRADCLPPPR